MENLVNQTFGRLTVKRLLSTNPVVWECECVCGTVLPVTHTHALKSGNTKSCGCLQREKAGAIKKQRPYEALYKRFKDCVLRHERRSNLSIPVKLTYEDFLQFTSVTECHYCGAEVSWAEYNTNINGAAYNLDRKDNSKGYETKNVVVCCKRCNFAKADRFTYNEWVEVTRWLQFSHKNPTKLESALRLATYAHAGQMDEDGHPHIQHCMEVMHIVKKWCEEHQRSERIFYPAERALKLYTLEELLIAAILHDSVEDSEGLVTLPLILSEYGEKVHTLVDGLTRRGLGVGEEKEFYRDFIYRAKLDPGVALIKSADLQHNRSRAFHIKQARWRDKLTFKYNVATRVLSTDPDYQPTWEQASMSWVNGDDGEHYYIADPNGKKIEISKAQVETLQAEWKKASA